MSTCLGPAHPPSRPRYHPGKGGGGDSDEVRSLIPPPQCFQGCQANRAWTSEANRKATGCSRGSPWRLLPSCGSSFLPPPSQETPLPCLSKSRPSCPLVAVSCTHTDNTQRMHIHAHTGLHACRGAHIHMCIHTGMHTRAQTRTHTRAHTIHCTCLWVSIMLYLFSVYRKEYISFLYIESTAARGGFHEPALIR